MSPRIISSSLYNARMCLSSHLKTSLMLRLSPVRPMSSSVSEKKKKRTAIVTGASRGIGKSVAIRLAQDGYDLCLNDISSNESQLNDVVSEIKSMGRKSISFVADVSKLTQVQDMINASSDELGPLTTMVANAGIVQVKPLLEVTKQDIQRMFEVNTFGVFYCYSEAAKLMIKQGGGGKIIGAASIAAYKPFNLLGHYAAAKFAVRGLTQGFAMELAEHKITVNCYAPGIVGTAMWEQIDEEMGKRSGAKKGETVKKYSRDMIPLGRTSVPEDVSKAVSFLAGPDSDYMTGQTLVVDGGIWFS